jgi:HTH-type transcriptional regulator/antitoxin HigA
MDIKPIKNTRDYRRALKEVEGLMHAKRNTPAGDRLDPAESPRAEGTAVR